MKKALLLSPMGSVHRRFNTANIQALQSLGYELHLVANFSNGDGPEKQNQEFACDCADRKIVIHSIAFQRHSLIKNLTCIKETATLIKNENYSIVHAHTETGGLILRLAGRPEKTARYFYTPHGMSFHQGSSLKSQLIYRPVEHWICSGMDVNIAINREEFSVLDKWNRKSSAFVHGIGLDMEKIRNYREERNEVRKAFGIPADAKIILSVGELDENKNHRIVIETLADLKLSDVYYVVCGVGPLQETLRKHATAHGLGDRVILAGYRRDIPDMIHASDLFAFPSYHEGLSVSLMEAMAGDLPVICSNIRGNIDLIEDGVNGYTTLPCEKQQWKVKLKNLLSDETLRDAFSCKGREKVKLYSMEYVKNELVVLYKSAE